MAISNLDNSNHHLMLKDINGEGENVLVASEGTNDPRTERAYHVEVEWLGLSR